VAISEETKNGLSVFLTTITAIVGALPYVAAQMVGTAMKQWITPEMVVQAAEACGIQEIIIIRGKPGSTFNGVIDQRTKPE